MMINKPLLWRFALPIFLFSIFQTTNASQAQPGSYNSNVEQNYAQDISNDGFYTWSQDKFPLKVYFEENLNVPGFRQSYTDLLRSCFDEWTQVSNGKLAWREVDDPRSADIKVTWSDQAVEASRGTEAGKTRNYARYNPSTNWGTIDRCEMRLLTRLPDREFSPVEMRKAYLHEVGHAFGIAGHSQNRNDIMYFSVSNHKQVHLSQADIGTLNYLYKQQGPIISDSETGVPLRRANPPAGSRRL